MAPDWSVIPPERLELTYVDGPAQVYGPDRVAAICVGGAYTKQTAHLIDGSGVELVTLVDWPQGLAKTTVRQIEAVAAAKDGTHAIEIAICHAVVNKMLDDDLRNGVRDGLAALVGMIREVSRAIEVRAAFNAYDFARKADAMRGFCRLAQESGMDGIVTAAGLPPAVPDYERAVGDLIRHADTLSVKVTMPLDADAPPQHWLDMGADRLGVCLHWNS